MEWREEYLNRVRSQGLRPTYNNYNRNKPSRHAPFRKIWIPKIPIKPWESITIDFIMGLLLSKDLITGIVYTNMIIIICKITKYMIIRLTPATLTAE
jgi:hypothetical protein